MIFVWLLLSFVFFSLHISGNIAFSQIVSTHHNQKGTALQSNKVPLASHPATLPLITENAQTTTEDSESPDSTTPTVGYGGLSTTNGRKEQITDKRITSQSNTERQIQEHVIRTTPAKTRSNRIESTEFASETIAVTSKPEEDKTKDTEYGHYQEADVFTRGLTTSTWEQIEPPNPTLTSVDVQSHDLSSQMDNIGEIKFTEPQFPLKDSQTTVGPQAPGNTFSKDKFQSTDVNLALKKPAFQSSEYLWGSPERATDGNSDTDFYKESCSHTGLSDLDFDEAWFVIDLEESYKVSKVVITNRGDCCGEYLSNEVEFKQFPNQFRVVA